MLQGHNSSLRDVRVGIKAGTLSKNDGKMLLVGSLTGSDLPSFLIQPETTKSDAVHSGPALLT